MKILVTGANGMLGREISRQLTDHEIIKADLDVCDITEAKGFEEFVSAHTPEIIIHCAAMTAVDDCETKIDQAFKINAQGSSNVAWACKKVGARLIAFSTDYVFDGELDRPYNEYDIPNPKTIYGKSKFAGEEAIRYFCPDHAILRISWLYGLGGPSFYHTMLKLADGSRPLLKIVSDQIGNPTSTVAVVNNLKNILDNPYLRGVFHFSCEGKASWFEFTEEIFKLKGINQPIAACTSQEYPSPAPRPKNSQMDKMNLRINGLPSMPCWKKALKEFVALEK